MDKEGMPQISEEEHAALQKQAKQLFENHGFRKGEMLNVAYFDPRTGKSRTESWRIFGFIGGPDFQSRSNWQPYYEIGAVDPYDATKFKHSVTLEEAKRENPDGSKPASTGIKVLMGARRVRFAIKRVLQPKRFVG